MVHVVPGILCVYYMKLDNNVNVERRVTISKLVCVIYVIYVVYVVYVVCVVSMVSTVYVVPSILCVYYMKLD